MPAIIKRVIIALILYVWVKDRAVKSIIRKIGIKQEFLDHESRSNIP